MNEMTKRILLVGNAREFASIRERLAARDCVVEQCSDGALALQKALEFHPELILAETAIATVPAARLAQILRANPKSGEVAFVFIGGEGEQVEGFQKHRDHFLTRPFNPEQLTALIAGFFGRRERARQLGGVEKEVSGRLAQIALVDLLQIFGLNRKSGALNLERGNEKGALFLVDGRLINARCGRVEGEKAFCRLLAWDDGNFSFAPGACDCEARMSGPLDHLIMEGLRLNDEHAAQQATLPSLDARLSLRIPRENLPQGLRPATRDILLKLQYYPRVADLLDHCPQPDFMILQVLRALLDKGVVEECQDAQQVAERLPLLPVADMLAARQHFAGDGSLHQVVPRLILLSTVGVQLRPLLQTLKTIPEFEPDRLWLTRGGASLGTIGKLTFSETFALEFFHLPTESGMSPLWPVFARSLFGVVSLAPPAAVNEAVKYFNAEAGVGSIAWLHGDGPSESTFLLRPGDRSSLAALFVFLAGRFIPVPGVAEA